MTAGAEHGTSVPASGALTHSRTLFLRDDGVPLCFYISPGPTKASLSPLIVHGGGVVCRLQERGAILLTGPGARPSGYTRAQYVLDSVERNQQLALEDYAADQQQQPPSRPAPLPPSRGGPACAAGRTVYTRKEDVAILMYVRRYAGPRGGGEGSVLGNALWREMARVQLTGHSWQSMKEHYLRRLRGRDHLYQIDSRSVIPTVIFPVSAGAERAAVEEEEEEEEEAGQRVCRPEAGKKNPGTPQHVDMESKEDAPAPVEQVPNDVSSEEECFNIFPVAIREFEVEEETPELLTETSDEMEIEKAPQEQQMKTDQPPQVTSGEHQAKRKETLAEEVPQEQQMDTAQPPQVNPGEHQAKWKGTLAEFIMDNEQSELDSPTPVDELTTLPAASQDEVDCAIRAINTLMQTHDLDLCAATQLLLKNNGELAAALHFLETGHRPDGYPIWTLHDDLDLEVVDDKVQQRLIQKYGSENLAKRIAFRKS
uniref:telomeric repeat-binding factor 2-interacting protein 1 n=1 Tax=Pristiophorus japonicus TaxID=55135 RepID=UPI00398E9E88